MARINFPGFEELASRVFSVKGPGALTGLQDDVFATVPVDRGAPIEWRFPQRIYSWAYCAAIAGAGAGSYNGIQLTNTSTDRWIIVEGVQASNITANALFYAMYRTSYTTDIFPAGLFGQPRDRRVVQTPDFGSVGGAVIAGGIPAGWTLIGHSTAVAYHVAQWNTPYLIYPGDSFAFIHQNINQTCYMSAFWTTRLLSAGER